MKKEITICKRCGKRVCKLEDCVHTCTPIYGFESFKKYFENKKSISENPDNIPDIEYWSGTRKIDFLQLFIEVFGDLEASYIEVNYHLGFVVINGEAYIDKSFLDFCKENNIKNSKAYNLYMDFADEMARNNGEGNEKDFLEFFKKNKKDYI